ncbi:TadE/TadG family type IV pilus assembly protein [Novosphingobium sediminicola]|uniref:Flp pilus assembly protein TadG n=1 Tax=Novosphingobium sediminicola TaxID=563162 RepID=A0A7W6CBZ2_9SPHN|nr:Flp pilus assembly protein TadG [Novosphingobium sediminicola]
MVWVKLTSHLSGSRLGLRLWHDRAGAAMVEFALVGPAFIALIVAIFQTTFTFIAGQGLETATEASARLLMTGQAQSASYTADQFKTAACATLPPYLSCNNLYIDVTTASSFSSASLAAPTITYDSSGNVSNSFSYTPGSSGAIVVVRFFYLWPTLTGPLGFSLVTTGKSQHLLVATALMKAEGY